MSRRQKAREQMQVVIDIPKEMYKSALSGYLCGSETLVNAIKNGTPLRGGRDINQRSIQRFMYESEQGRK